MKRSVPSGRTKTNPRCTSPDNAATASASVGGTAGRCKIPLKLQSTLAHALLRDRPPRKGCRRGSDAPTTRVAHVTCEGTFAFLFPAAALLARDPRSYKLVVLQARFAARRTLSGAGTTVAKATA